MDKEKLNKRKAAWDKTNTTMISVKLQNSTDSDILAFLEGKAKQTVIKEALREYIKNHQKKVIDRPFWEDFEEEEK